jgi:hypothetical protein
MAHHIPKITYGGFVPTVISFTYPPTEPDPERRVLNRKTTESLSGMRSVNLSNVEAIRKLKFRFITEAQKTSLETFIETFAAYGKAFRYYDDKNSSSYKTYEFDQEKFEPKMITAVGPNAYIYEFDIQLRRVVDAAVREGVIDMEIANNQAAAADVSALALDSASYRAVEVFFEVWRKTASSERLATGSFKCFYKDSTEEWEMVPGSYEGDETGVTFTVTVAGQVQYTSDNMAGTGYESRALFRNFTILEG